MTLRRRILVGTAIALGAVIAGAALLSRKMPALEHFGPAPRFQLIDSSGQPFNSETLQGRVWIASFFFSRCPGICPAMNGRIAAVYSAFKGNRQVQILSISIDPEHDTPQILEEYRKRFVVDRAQWHFLTGELEVIRSVVADGFKLVTADDPNLHTTRIVLVDQQGEIRGFYQGTEDDMVARLEDDIAKLL